MAKMYEVEVVSEESFVHIIVISFISLCFLLSPGYVSSHSVSLGTYAVQDYQSTAGARDIITGQLKSLGDYKKQKEISIYGLDCSEPKRNLRIHGSSTVPRSPPRMERMNTESRNFGMLLPRCSQDNVSRVPQPPTSG